MNHVKVSTNREKQATATPTPRRIRPRTLNQGSAAKPRKVTIRVTERISNELASIQGLMYAFGKREKLSDVFERVLMPSLRAYVTPYTEAAKAARTGEGVRS